jgi:hypothetical protein
MRFCFSTETTSKAGVPGLSIACRRVSPIVVLLSSRLSCSGMLTGYLSGEISACVRFNARMTLMTLAHTFVRCSLKYDNLSTISLLSPDESQVFPPCKLDMPGVMGLARHWPAIALTGGGCVWTCGGNNYGQLGHGDMTGKHLFIEIQMCVCLRLLQDQIGHGHFGGASIVMAAAGWKHSVVASAAGDVFTWGFSMYGCLGLGNEQDRLAPARLSREQAVWRGLARSCLWPPGRATRWRWQRAGCCGCGVLENMASWVWATGPHAAGDMSKYVTM